MRLAPSLGCLALLLFACGPAAPIPPVAVDQMRLGACDPHHTQWSFRLLDASGASTLAAGTLELVVVHAADATAAASAPPVCSGTATFGCASETSTCGGSVSISAACAPAEPGTSIFGRLVVTPTGGAPLPAVIVAEEDLTWDVAEAPEVRAARLRAEREAAAEAAAAVIPGIYEGLARAHAALATAAPAPACPDTPAAAPVGRAIRAGRLEQVVQARAAGTAIPRTNPMDGEVFLTDPILEELFAQVAGSDDARLMEDLAGDAPRVLVVRTTRITPPIENEGTASPGSFEGEVVIVDTAEGRILCVVPVSVIQSEATIRYDSTSRTGGRVAREAFESDVIRAIVAVSAPAP